MKTAKEIFNEIKGLKGTERYKLVKDVLEFTKKPDDTQTQFLIELIEELTKIKLDIEFLSGKIGFRDLYSNRMSKQTEEKLI